ncbi:MAG: addiction module protein [Thermoguttaceae bacterium]
MSVDPANVLDAALTLSDTERAGLAYRLLHSLKPPAVMSEDDPAFQAELDRRVDAYESGESTAEDWHDVSQRLRKEFKGRTPA